MASWYRRLHESISRKNYVKHRIALTAGALTVAAAFCTAHTVYNNCQNHPIQTKETCFKQQSCSSITAGCENVEANRQTVLELNDYDVHESKKEVRVNSYSLRTRSRTLPDTFVVGGSAKQQCAVEQSEHYYYLNVDEATTTAGSTTKNGHRPAVDPLYLSGATTVLVRNDLHLSNCSWPNLYQRNLDTCSHRHHASWLYAEHNLAGNYSYLDVAPLVYHCQNFGKTLLVHIASWLISPESNMSAPSSPANPRVDEVVRREEQVQRYNSMEYMIEEVKKDIANMNDKLKSLDSNDVEINDNEDFSDVDSLNEESADNEFSFYYPTKSSTVKKPLWSLPRPQPEGAASVDELLHSVKSDFSAISEMLNQKNRSQDDINFEKLSISSSTNIYTSISTDLDQHSQTKKKKISETVVQRRQHKEEWQTNRSQSEPIYHPMERDSLEEDSLDHDSPDFDNFWVSQSSSNFINGGTTSFKQNAPVMIRPTNVGGEIPSSQNQYSEFSDSTRHILLKLKGENPEPYADAEEAHYHPSSPDNSPFSDADISDFIINTYDKDADYDYDQPPQMQYQSIHDILRTSGHIMGSARCLFPILEESSDELSSSDEEESEMDGNDNDYDHNHFLFNKNVPTKDQESDKSDYDNIQNSPVRVVNVNNTDIEMIEIRGKITPSDDDLTTDLDDIPYDEQLPLASDSASSFYTAIEGEDGSVRTFSNARDSYTSESYYTVSENEDTAEEDNNEDDIDIDETLMQEQLTPLASPTKTVAPVFAKDYDITPQKYEESIESKTCLNMVQAKISEHSNKAQLEAVVKSQDIQSNQSSIPIRPNDNWEIADKLLDLAEVRFDKLQSDKTGLLLPSTDTLPEKWSEEYDKEIVEEQTVIEEQPTSTSKQPVEELHDKQVIESSDDDSTSESDSSEYSSTSSEEDSTSDSEYTEEDSGLPRYYDEVEDVTERQLVPVKSLDDVDLAVKTKRYSITADDMRRWQKQHWRRRRLEVITEVPGSNENIDQLLNSIGENPNNRHKAMSDLDFTRTTSTDFVPPLDTLPMMVEDDVQLADSAQLRQQMRQQMRETETTASDDEKLMMKKGSTTPYFEEDIEIREVQSVRRPPPPPVPSVKQKHLPEPTEIDEQVNQALSESNRQVEPHFDEYSYITPLPENACSVNTANSVTAVASSKATISKSNSSGNSGHQQAYVTTQATGARPHIAVARAAAKAASIASATVNRASGISNEEEYKIYISTSCTIKPTYPSTNAPLLDAKKLQITVSSEQKYPTHRSVTTQRRLDKSEANENIFSLLNLHRTDTTNSATTHELPSPTKTDEYDQLEMATKSILKNSIQKDRVADVYTQQVKQTVEDELKSRGISKVEQLGKIKTKEERFEDIRKQLDALKARQAARQAQDDFYKDLNTSQSMTRLSEPISPNRPKSPTLKLEVKSSNVASNLSSEPNSPRPQSIEPLMAESAYITDSSPSTAPNSPPEEDNPFKDKKYEDLDIYNINKFPKEKYKSVLQESISEHYPVRSRHKSSPEDVSIASDQERIRKAREEYYSKRIVLTDIMKSRASKSPSAKLIEKAKAAKKTQLLDKNQSKSLHTLREVMNDDDAVRKYAPKSENSRQRFKSTDLDELVSNGSRSSSTYDLNMYSIRPGQIKSMSLYDFKSNETNVLSPMSANQFTPDSKSYASLIETDIDTTEDVLHSNIDDMDSIDNDDHPMRTQSLFDLNNRQKKRANTYDGLDYSSTEDILESNGTLNRAASEDLLNEGKGNQCIKGNKETFMNKLCARAQSERELDVCQSLGRLDIPHWLNHLEISDSPFEPLDESSRYTPRYHSRKNSQTSEVSENSYKPLIIATRVTMPSRPSLRSPMFSPIGTTGSLSSEPPKKLFELSSERYKKEQHQETRKSYYTPTRCSVRSISQEDLLKYTEEKKQKKDSVKLKASSTKTTPKLEPLKLSPSDFISKKNASLTNAAKPFNKGNDKAHHHNLEKSITRTTTSVKHNETISVKTISKVRADVAPPPIAQPHHQNSNVHLGERNGQSQDTSNKNEQVIPIRSIESTSTSSSTSASATTSDSDSSSSTTYDSSSDSSSTGESETEEDSTQVANSLPTLAIKPIKTTNQDQTVTVSKTEDEQITVKSSVVYTKIRKTFSGDSKSISDVSTNVNNPAYHSNKGVEKKSIFELGLQSWQSDAEVLTFDEGYAVAADSKPKAPLLTFVSKHSNKEDVNMSLASEEARKHFALLTLKNDDSSQGKLTIRVLDDNEMSGRKSPDLSLDEIMHALNANSAVSPLNSIRTNSSSSDNSINNNWNNMTALTHSQDACSPSGEKTFFPNNSVFSLTEIQCGVIKEGNQYLIECINPRCAKRRELFEAKKSYCSCHNCYTYYCSRTCRNHHWEAHKRVCIFSRINSSCKHVIRAVLENSTSIYHLSRIARTGYLCLGRGCVLLVFDSIQSAQEFSKEGVMGLAKNPVFISLKEMTQNNMFQEQMRDIVQICKTYDPETHFVVNVAVSAADQIHVSSVPMPRHEGPMIKKWACIHLSDQHIRSSVSTSETSSTNSTVILTNVSDKNEELKTRQLFFTNVQRTLKQRGVILRIHYPELYDNLLEYVDSGKNFAPQTIYPMDNNTGKKFMCCIMPNSDPIIQWVSDPQTMKQLDLSLEAPRRRSAGPHLPTKSTDL